MAQSQINLLVGWPVASPWNAISTAIGIGVLEPPTTTEIVIASEFGYKIVFHGAFTVAGGDVTAGTMTGFDVFTGSTKVMEGSAYSASGAALFDAIETTDFGTVFALLLDVPLKIVGSSKDDDAEGSAFNDVLIGRAGNDWLMGWDGDDFIKAGKGNDLLAGEQGFDILSGGPGADVFAFQLDPLSPPVGFDRLRDFKVGEDLIGLDIFGPDAPPPGYLEKPYFHRGTEATTDQQVVIYDKDTGRIFFDVDGIGIESQFQFAKVKPGTKLHADDFYVGSNVIF